MKQPLIFLIILFATISAFSAEYYVDASRPDDTGLATNWATAKKTIQAAVDLTTDGDKVWVTNGTYNLSSEISVTKAITVQSVNDPEETIVDGGGGNRCFKLSGDCLISGFTVSNGVVRFPEVGGGVHCSDEKPVVSNCYFISNVADQDFVTSWAGDGGGMYRGTALNCVFDSNGAFLGGGMAEGTARDCVFTNNYGIGGPNWGNSYGAGMSGGEAQNCLFVNNDAYAGGGVDSAIVRNSLFMNNTAHGGGGAFDSTIINCTFFGNTAFNQGAGVEIGMVYNCIFKNNTT